MNTNQHITTNHRARLTAPPCFMNPRLQGDGFAPAHVYALVLENDSRD